MGCAASKPSREGEDGNAHGEQLQKGPTSPTTPLPKLLAGQSAAGAADEDPNQAGTPTTSDASTYSHSSQLSTWDMRTMQGPITTTASSKKTTTTAAAAPATIQTAPTDPSQPPATAPGPLSPSLTALQISLPSFSQRMRSPSILGTPALDTPLAPAQASPTEKLVVTKIGGCTLVNQYLVVQYLGRGTSGKVYLCVDVLDRRLYAVKIVRKTAREEKKEGKVEEETEKASSIAGAGGGNESSEDVDKEKDKERKEEVKGKDSQPSFPSSDVDKFDKFAAKAERMKEKAALRNKNTPTPTKNTNPPSSSSAKKQQNSSSSTNYSNTNRSKNKNLRDPLLDLRREVEILRNVGSNHPNVVTLREIVDDPTSNKMLIVMEYCEGGPVMTRAGLERGRRIPESVARPYFRDMIAALGHLHKNRVIHGDLKPENALMSANGRIALSDFGCSKILRDDDPRNDLVDRCNGTPAFLAPEMMVSGATFRGRPADVYALGACLFTFIFGRIPFTADSVLELFRIVKTQELNFPDIPADASNEVKALLRGLLAKDPEKRMTLEKAAKHRWVTDNGRLPAVSLSLVEEASKKKNIWVDDPHIVDGDASLAGLLSCSGVEIVNFLPGEVLMRQGDRSTSIMYILRGDVDVLYRPSEEVIRGAQQRNSSNNSTNNTLIGEKEEGEKGQNQKNGGGGGGGIGGAITKLWSPSARLKRSARDTRSSVSTNIDKTPSSINAVPSLDLTRATTSGGGAGGGVSSSSSLPPLPPQMLSARSTGIATGTATGMTPRVPLTSPRGSSLVSPRERSLMLGLGNTPEPSPRFPIHSSTGAASTGALSTSNFQIYQGIGTCGSGVGSHALDSAVTTPRNETPAITPLPSARGNESGSGSGNAPLLSLSSAVAAAGTADDVVVEGGDEDINRGKDDVKEREPTPFFTPLPGPSIGNGTGMNSTSTIITSTNITPGDSVVLSEDDNNTNSNQNFVTPGNVLSPLSPLSSSTPLSPAGAAMAPRVGVSTSTPGSGGSTLAAYPLVLTPRDMAEERSGDLDNSSTSTTTNNEEEEEERMNMESNVQGNGVVPSSQGAVTSSFTTPVIHPTIHEEEEPQATILNGSVHDDSDGNLSSLNPIGPPRPDSGSSWAPQLSRDVSAQTTFDIERRETINADIINKFAAGACEYPPRSSTKNNIPCALAEAAEEAGGFIQSLYRDTHSYNTKTKSGASTSSAEGGSSRSRNKTSNGGGEYLLAIRGAGDFIGETALIGGSSVRRSCSVRASTKTRTGTTTTTTEDTVQVAVIPYSAAKDYLKQYPLAKQRLAEMVWSRQSETIVLEGLLRLAGISKELHDEARKHISP